MDGKVGDHNGCGRFRIRLWKYRLKPKPALSEPHVPGLIGSPARFQACAWLWSGPNCSSAVCRSRPSVVRSSGATSRTKLTLLWETSSP